VKVLSELEVKLARQILTGMTNLEIAAESGLGLMRIDNHIATIMNKFDASTRAELIAVLRTELARMEP
jgi:DNA-binding CsgD family transcriptional regulator